MSDEPKLPVFPAWLREMPAGPVLMEGDSIQIKSAGGETWPGQLPVGWIKNPPSGWRMSRFDHAGELLPAGSFLAAGDSVPGGQPMPVWMETFINDANHTWPHPDEVRRYYPACKFIRTVPFA